MIRKLITTILGCACMISANAQKDSPDCADKDGVGPLAPISTNANEEGRKLNRRVEVVLK